MPQFDSHPIRMTDSEKSSGSPAPIRLGPEVTIGISAYGNHVTTKTCLQSLFQSATGDFELILVDDCSRDNGEIRSLFQAAKKEHKNTKLFFFTENLEYSGSLNAILSHGSGRWLLFLSNDIFVTPSYLRAVLGVAQSNEKFGIVRGCSNFVDNGLSTHNIGFPRRFTFSELSDFAATLETEHAYTQLFDDYLTGDAFLVSRTVLDKIGTFDPFFFGYFADHDFGLRAQLAGFELVLAKGAFAYHDRAANFEYLPASLREEKKLHRWMRVIENWARFKSKYGLPVEALYQGINSIPWVRLRRGEFSAQKHYAAPGDYLKYLV